MKLSFVRALFLAVLVAAVFLPARATLAAPTCQDRDGLTIRCGTDGAMPVGWTLPFEERRFQPPAPSTGQISMLIGVLGLLFALIALLPEFDGSRSADWDKQEGDDQESA
jgi:hypothetical protein